MNPRNVSGSFLRRWRNASGIFLLLAGCAGLEAPRPEDVEAVRRLPPPPGPYARVTAVADLETEHLSGTFDVLVLARSGRRPVVRLQLLPDLGGKALDLVASPDHLTGWFPVTGEGVDWDLPGQASAHPLLFFAITLLERFAPVTEDRVAGVADGVIELEPVVEGSRVRYARSEFRFGWGAAIGWTARRDRVDAPGLRLVLRDVKIEPLGTLDEALLKLELPDDVRRR
jgi:hypothetical protein